MEADFVTKCPGAERTRVWVRTETCTEREVRAALAAAGGAGWVCGRSETPSAWRGGALPPSTILSAEVLAASGRSVHVRYGGDAWLVTTVAETAFEGAKVEDCVAFDDEVLSSIDRPRGSDRPKLTYRTYWKAEEIDEVRVWRPWLSRFTGWKGIEERA